MSNSGQTVSVNDVLDAYELMEKLLTEVFDEESKKIMALAKDINNKRDQQQNRGSSDPLSASVHPVLSRNS